MPPLQKRLRLTRAKREVKEILKDYGLRNDDNNVVTFGNGQKLTIEQLVQRRIARTAMG